MLIRNKLSLVAGVLFVCIGAALAQSRGSVDQALQDFAAGKPLPGMPNLKKPVFLVAGAIVCESPGALANPNKDVLVTIGACALTESRHRVSVLPPRTQPQYLDSYVFKMVQVVWRSADISDATAHSGWTNILNVQN